MTTALEIRQTLLSLGDEKHADFQSRLIPGIDRDRFVGIKTPALRQLAKELCKVEYPVDFLQNTPHGYFEENQLHAFILGQFKDFDACIDGVDRFLPYVDNWATTDQLSPKVFARHRDDLIAHVFRWIADAHTFTVRFGIGMLMEHYLDAGFDPSYPGVVAEIRSDEYYVNMMRAWYFATALAKQYESVIALVESHQLDAWTHNKTIQKCVESYRISDEQKEYLRKFRRK